MHRWVFGYGSLIWRPDIPFRQRRPARLKGWQRRFWQGSHDHRGVPERPGRVVTLIPTDRGFCDGVAYEVDAEVIHEVYETLDYREKNGYERYTVTLEFHADGSRNARGSCSAGAAEGLVYIAPQDNHAFLGPAPTAAIARQIRESRGPSGHNVDYLLELADALRRLDAHDPHVFELEAAVRGVEAGL